MADSGDGVTDGVCEVLVLAEGEVEALIEDVDVKLGLGVTLMDRELEGLGRARGRRDRRGCGRGYRS